MDYVFPLNNIPLYLPVYFNLDLLVFLDLEID